MPRSLSLPLALALLAVPATAQITYVDADPATNTTLADGSPFVPNPLNDGSDNNWSNRPFANGGTIFSTNDVSVAGLEDGPMLRTTIGGLLPGFEYLVYSYCWNASGSSDVWRLRSKVDTSQPAPDIQGYNTRHFPTSSFLPSTGLAFDAPIGPQQILGLNYDAAGLETDGHFTAPVLIQEGNRWMYEVPLGIHLADGNGEIHVYVDDLANTATNNRTWYDGVGYELAPQRFGNSCGTPTPPGIFFSGVPHLNAEMTLAMRGAQPNAAAVLVVGISNTTWNGRRLPFDLTPFGAPGCQINVSPDVTAGATTDANGDASITFLFSNVAPATLYWQWLALGTGISATQGIETVIHR